MARKEYPDEVRAAVMAALLEGQGAAKVAEEYNIPEGTIASWKSRMVNGDAIVSIASEKRDQLGELLMDYLAANLTTLRMQIEGVHRDEEWLKKQSAGELATLHGVSMDKAIRLLEALSRANVDGNPDK